MTYAESLIQEGILKGIRESEHKAQINIAQQLLKSGVDVSVVMNATHLSKKELEQLQKSLH